MTNNNVCGIFHFFRFLSVFICVYPWLILSVFSGLYLCSSVFICG
ncbi:MAG: hypothetical protein HQM09_06675 [Candidatus Riflebacteria bacterium]|nr:hypothetical protein [Candidatus Riflebacteria bacterium]